MFFQSIFQALSRFFRREAGVLIIAVLAVASRLVWNLRVHPPREYVFSDMFTYFASAQDFATQPLDLATPHLSFYPWGTYAFLGMIRRFLMAPGVCPKTVANNIAATGCAPMDIGLALLGAMGVIYTTLIARRLTSLKMESGCLVPIAEGRWRYFPIGLFTVVYYPLLAQTGYYLSEGPFFAGLSAMTFHYLRFADTGKKRDAFLAGMFGGLAAIVRPQALVSVALLLLFSFFRRRSLRGIRLAGLVSMALPLICILTFSAIRTTRHIRKHDPTEMALVSTNDALNYAFGRCHAIAIEAHAPHYSAFFGPPSLGSLHFGVKKRLEAGLWSPLTLDPAFPPDAKCDSNKKRLQNNQPMEPCIEFSGKMWDRDVLQVLAKKCIEKTGWARQAYYAVTHVLIGFGFNVTWPDSAQRDTLRATVLGVPVWAGRQVMAAWQVGFAVVILPFAITACILSFRRKDARNGILAMHLWATVIVSALYFGETRLRTPYDFCLIVLGLDCAGRFFRSLRRVLPPRFAARQ